MGRLFLIGTAVSLVITFFPFFLETDVYIDVNRKKFVFSLYLWKFLKLVGGYATPYAGGVALHISKKKAVLLPYEKMESERKKISFIRAFRLVSFSITTETGAEYVLPVALAHTSLKILFAAFGGEKQKSSLWLTDGDTLKISARVVVFFNLFILSVAFFKSLKEKLKILWQKKTKKSVV